MAITIPTVRLVDTSFEWYRRLALFSFFNETSGQLVSLLSRVAFDIARTLLLCLTHRCQTNNVLVRKVAPRWVEVTISSEASSLLCTLLC